MRSRFQRLAEFMRELDRGLATMRGEVEPDTYRGAERTRLSGGPADSSEQSSPVTPVVRIQIREGCGT